jgi:organic hydroperoxide reductase OsmC/OhrA
MSAAFPHHYQVEVRSDEDAKGVLLSDGRPQIVGAPPPEFDGPEGHWSPEHLLLSSLALCLMTTYQALARRARVPHGRYQSRVKAVLDKTAEGIAFTSIAVEVDLLVEPEHVERTERLLESAKRHCIVSNALRPPVTLQARVSAAAAAPASA